MSKKTIAIIGAASERGIFFSKALAKAETRLLLFDHDLKNLSALVDEITSITSSADIEPMSCESDASWEADIILPCIEPALVKELASKIQVFANRKIVIATTGKEIQFELERSFPNATLVNIAEDADQPGFIVSSQDEEAAKLVKELMSKAGINSSLKRNSIHNYIKQSNSNTMETTKWILDPTHSEIHFKVRHLMVSWVTGNFKKFDASIETAGEDIGTAKIRFSADVKSISTNNEQRDAHLQANDFFDAENYPQLTFQSERLEKIDGENYKLYGTLSIRGNSKRVVLNVEYGGITKDPWGNMRTGFSVSGKINRKDFGVSFSMVSETGGILLGEDVSINANVEFVKQVVAQTQAA